MGINKYYNSKLDRFGKDDFRSLNWGDKEGKSAKARYQQMFDQYNWLDKKVSFLISYLNHLEKKEEIKSKKLFILRSLNKEGEGSIVKKIL